MAYFQRICRIFKLWLLIVTNIIWGDNIEEDIPGKVGVTSLVEKMLGVRLRWFGHVKRGNIDASLRRCESGSERVDER